MIINSNENKFVELISKIPNVAVQGYNKKREVIYWNEASQDIYGYTKEEALGKKLEDLIIPDFMRDDVVSLIAKWYEKGEVIPSSELPLQHKDGSRVFVYSSHVMLGGDTDSPEMFCVDIDLTKQKIQEKTLKTQDKLLTQQTRMAQMGEMISMIAHQWRQPLAAISTTVANLEFKIQLESFDLDTKEGQKKQGSYFLTELYNINSFVQNLTRTIDDFRNFYRPNKNIVKSSLEEVCEKSLSIIKPSLESAGIELVYEYNSKESLELHDSEMMQVILNIFKNAQDNFNEKQTTNPQIRIITQERSISICDNGGGIPEDIIDKIFDPYFSTKDEKNGTGLGLYMSKTIVEEHHNGKLKVENRDNGACFRIELSI